MIDFWQEIYGTIKRNKLRTFLTGFSVAWGIFILIVLLGAGNGLHQRIRQQLSKEVALNSVRIFSGQTSETLSGICRIGRNIQFSDNADLDPAQGQVQEERHHQQAPPSRNCITVSNGTNYVSLSEHHRACPELHIHRIVRTCRRAVSSSELDIRQKRKVVVLSEDSRRELFAKCTDPIGQYD
jgi:putative ABC transport system permease protein